MTYLNSCLEDPDSDLESLPTPRLLKALLLSVWRVCAAESECWNAQGDTSRGCRVRRQEAAASRERAAEERRLVDKHVYRRMVENPGEVMGCLKE
jgi:hypothetical protein